MAETLRDELFRQDTRHHFIWHIPGVFYMASAKSGYAGHAKLFGRCIYTFHNEVGRERGEGEWADHRTWSIGFVALHHVTPGKKSCNRTGWSLTFARLRLKRIHSGFSITWRWADTFRTPSSYRD